MAEPNDYLWDGSGADPEVERLEELFGALRVASVPPELPAQRGPGRWVAAAAALLLVSSAAVLMMQPQLHPSFLASDDGAGDRPARGDAGVPAGADPAPDGPLATGGASGQARSHGASDVVRADDVEAFAFAAGPVTFDDGKTTSLFFDEEGLIHTRGARLAGPRLSADGASVAFEVVDASGPATELWVAELTGHQVHRLSRRGEGATGAGHARSLAWSSVRPRQFAYLATDPGNGTQIHLSRGGRPIGLADPRDPAWDPTRHRFVFTDNGDLYLWDDETVVQLTYDAAHQEQQAQFSPDGDQVVFVSAGPDTSDLMLLDVDQFAARPLLEPGPHRAGPSFSPDDGHIAFVSTEDSTPGTLSLWVLDLSGARGPRQIAETVRAPAPGGFLSWTPDGEAVVAVLVDPSTNDCVALVPIDGSGPTCIDLGTDLNRDPHLVSIGPDWLLAWTSLRGTGRQLNIARLESD